MKHLLLTAAATCLWAPFAQADFIGVYGKAGVWNASFEGSVASVKDKTAREQRDQDIPTFSDRGFEEDNHNTGWIAFEHPIPFIPNLRLAYTALSSAYTSPGDISVDKATNIEVNGVQVTFDAGQPIDTDMTFDVIDGTLYWELLDNVASLDLGITVRSMDGEFTESIDETILPIVPQGTCSTPTRVSVSGILTVDGCTRPPQTSITPIDIILPMLYGKVRFDLPFSGLYTAMTAQGISFDGNTMTDIDIEFGYLFNFTVMEAGFSVGYRRAELKSKDLEGLFADASIDGFHTSLDIHF